MFKINFETEEIKVIYIYRYLSLILNSIVYLLSKPYNVFYFKLGVIISLLISGKFITDLYIKFKDNKKFLRKLVLIESIGIDLLLVPTGGLSSPFIWYALNPSLVSASYLSKSFCWLNLVFYLLSGSIVNYILFNPANLNIIEFIFQHIDIILVFLLVNLLIQLLSNLTKKLQVLYKEKDESVEHIMSLYQIVEAFNSHSNKEKLFEVLSSYTAKLTKSIMCVIWLREDDLIKTSNYMDEIELSNILIKFKELKIENITEVQILNNSDKDYILIPIISSSEYYGLIAVFIDINNVNIEQYGNMLKFISDLCCVTLERFNLEVIGEELLVLEEQNRIANEIHDSVSQRLFSVSYGIHGILGNLHKLTNEEIIKYLTEIKESSNSAMKELRNSIYKLSSKKNGVNYLQNTIKSYLDSISFLHKVEINFTVEGDETLLPLNLKQGITRIIRESSGNAIKHGKSNKIEICLVINRENVNLSIIDNGIGFLFKNIKDKGGLGLTNINNLVNYYYGIINITSNIDKGTNIQIQIPINRYTLEVKESEAI